MGARAPEAVIILAAGAGTRMNSSMPKVLHRIAGRPLLGHVMLLADALKPRHLVVVVGHQAELVRFVITDELAELISTPPIVATQTELKGTGDAVKCALRELPNLQGDVVVLNGDAPLLTPETMRCVITERDDTAAVVVTARVPDPSGLGRIVRNGDGALEAIVEERDASDEERAIAEVNSGAYVFDAERLSAGLASLKPHNEQKQEYLTDVIAFLRQAGDSVNAHCVGNWHEALGCNDRAELANVAAIMRNRIATRWMRGGVTIEDPQNVWIDADVVIGNDVVIAPGVQIRGDSYVGDGAFIGPDSTLVNTRVGSGTNVVRSHCVDARMGDNCQIGPFSYLRPGTLLADDVKIGAFVEVKNSQLDEGAKVPHLTYVGDAQIGEGTNIGASSVFVNYDGENKHQTIIGRHCRTGSDTMFVAPVTVGDGAYTAAGSVITEDVPPGALAVARARQSNIEEWVLKKRPGSRAAEAASEALQE